MSQPSSRKRLRVLAGLTMIELLIAISIMVIVVGTLGELTRAVHTGSEYGAGYGEATQHARVIIERISRMVSEATASEQFPGFIVVSEQSGGWDFPDALVVWHPSGTAVDPDGLPRYNELVIYTVDGTSHNQLLEVTIPSNSATVPDATDDATWQSLVAQLKADAAGQRVVLTELVRTCPVGATAPGARRGAVRFQSRLRPSAAEWTDYQDGNVNWEDLSWVQGIYGSKTGLRQAWVRMEIQLMPGQAAIERNAGSQEAIPFLGSAAIYYPLHRTSP